MIAVAGGTGFVGAAIAAELSRRGEPVRVLSRSPGRARLPRAETVAADVLDPASLPAALEGVETVVMAVQFPGYPVEVPRKDLTFDRYDRQGTENLVAAAAAAGVRRVVYISGVGADPTVHKPWFRAKGFAELAVTGSGMEWAVLRPTWLYGPADNSLNRFVTMSRWSPLLPVVGDGRQRLQPAFIGDLAHVAAEACGGRLLGKVVEVGGPAVLSMDDIMRTLLRTLGRRRRLVHVPPVLPRLAGTAAQLLPRPPLSAPAVDFLLAEALADLTQLRSELDMRLTPLAEGLASYLAPPDGSGRT